MELSLTSSSAGRGDQPGSADRPQKRGDRGTFPARTSVLGEVGKPVLPHALHPHRSFPPAERSHMAIS